MDDRDSDVNRRKYNIFGARPLPGDRRATPHLWLISYSDFMTILMIFFLLMYGYSYLAKDALFQMQGRQISYSEFSEKMHELKNRLDSNLQINEDLKKIVVQMPDNVLFSSGDARLAPEALRTIEELANSIKLVSGTVIVEGHTDNVPVVRGRYKSNWELSAARAFSVIDALTQAGVSPNRLSAWGFGENRPVAGNVRKADRRKNRRIEIVLLKKVSKSEPEEG